MGEGADRCRHLHAASVVLPPAFAVRASRECYSDDTNGQPLLDLVMPSAFRRRRARWSRAAVIDGVLP